MFGKVKEMLKLMNEDKELIPMIARGYRIMYDALLEQGFIPEQAMQIIASQGMGISKT